MTDWNWFFSSLSQSTAAIVGLFGAFIFTKIINSEQKFKINKDKILEFSLYSKNLKRKLSDRKFDWYNKRTREEALEELKDAINDDNEILKISSKEIYKDYNFSPFDKKDLILKEIDDLKEIYNTAGKNEF